MFAYYSDVLAAIVSARMALGHMNEGYVASLAFLKNLMPTLELKRPPKS